MGVKTRKLGNVNDQLVQWQAVHVSDGSTALTTVAGRGYFIDTTSGTQTVNLPAAASSSLGDTIMLKDYARTWGTNKITMGSNTFDGATNTPEFDTTGQTVTFVFMGANGWSLINEDTTTGLGATYVAATGGTVTTSGNFKIHTFTGDGNFVVSNAGNSQGSNKVSYLVVGGGGAGGKMRGGGGGAGGFREGRAPAFDSYTASPLVAPDGLTVSAQTYPITVGAGSTAATGSSSPPDVAPNNGTPSVFSTITSTGGGKGAGSAGEGAARSGGSGGGSMDGASGGAGNTPPVSPPQGNTGGVGAGSPNYGSGAGGGAGATGGNGSTSTGGGGGAGVSTEITGSAVVRAGGGGGSSYNGGNPGPAHPGGGGGGAGGSSSGSGGADGSANTGGGGGGGYEPGPEARQSGGNGGKGIVVIRYKFQ